MEDWLLHRPRRLILAVSGMALALAALGSPAATAAPTLTQSPAATPTVTVRPAVSGFSVSVGYSIDRPASAIAKQVCWVRNPAKVLTRVACDKTPEPTSTTSLTKFRKSLTVTKAGTNAFLVRFTLTNGRVILGGRSFTIKPGPVARFSVTGLFDQTIACDARLCPGDWVNDVARQIARVTARDAYGNKATGYTGTVVFDGFATTVSESKLTRGVGFFAVKPTGLQLNQFSHCAAGVPSIQAYKALTVTDKTRPAIRGCQVIFYDIFFVLDPLPIFRNITPDGCATGCLEDPTETIVIDTEVRPIQVLEVETITLPQSPTSSVMVVGETAEGQGFAQELTLENPKVESSDLPSALEEKCTGCSTPLIYFAVELAGTLYMDGELPSVEVPAGGGEIKLSDLQAVYPGLGFNFFAPVQITNSNASKPTCYRSYAALFDVNPGAVACGSL